MILIFSEKDSPRLRYVLDELLVRRMHVGYTLTSDKVLFEQSDTTKINYSHHSFSGCITIIPHGLLEETSIRQFAIKVVKDKWWRYYFFEQDTSPIPFDLFAASFWLLSRYEEYRPATKDQHGRYKSESSLAVQEGFITIPIVDVWAQQLGYHLGQQFPGFNYQPNPFRFISTIDIDFAFRYIGMGAKRQCLKLLKSLAQARFSDFATQLLCMTGLRKDPYDTYDYIRQLAQTHGISLIYFVLMKSGTAYDKNIAPTNPHLRQLLLKLQKHGQLGLHPSYYSKEQINWIEEEKSKLESILQKPTSLSRQHFLRLTIPDTYRQLALADFESDYSMGYSDIAGFRASTCNPFLFFDLLTNHTAAVLVHPVALMDTTLRYAMKLTPEEANKHAVQLMNEVQKTGGLFISIWHNSNLGKEEGWEIWRGVFEKMHTLASVKHLENGD